MGTREGGSSRVLVLGLLLFLLAGYLTWKWITDYGPKLQVERKRQAEILAIKEAAQAATEVNDPSFERAAAKRIVETRAAKGTIAELRQKKRAITRQIGQGLPIRGWHCTAPASRSGFRHPLPQPPRGRTDRQDGIPLARATEA